MQINRHGSKAFHGSSTIELKKPSCRWNPNENTIELTKSGVKDFNTDSTHDYTVSIDLDDFMQMLSKVIGAMESVSSEAVINAFTEKLVEIQRTVATIAPPFNVPRK